MDRLFTPVQLGSLLIPNRLVRSATAENMADERGAPLPPLEQCYDALARGGVGLIVTGHMYVHPGGKCHRAMTGIYDEALIPVLARLAEVVHRAGGLICAQINHGGMQSSRDVVDDAVAPSAITAPFLKRPARELTGDEIGLLIDAYAQAARRAQEAGMDAVQLHGAHGYLINQFLSPFVNRRTDEWGGSAENRMRFLREVVTAVRAAVGRDYPLWIKLGMYDAVEGGLTVEEAVGISATLAPMELDGLEVSGGIGGGKNINSRPGVRPGHSEAYFRAAARAARRSTPLPIALVGGLRSRVTMEDVLASGDADLISICRPLICDPALPQKMRTGQQDQSTCIGGNRCWPETAEHVGIGCKCPTAAPEAAARP